MSMSLRISGKNLDIGDVLRSQAKTRVAEALSKYFDGGYSGHVTVERDGSGFRTECTLHLDSGATMHVEGEANDAYQSLGRAVERIAKQLRRYKRKRGDTHDGDDIEQAALNRELVTAIDDDDLDDIDLNSAVRTMVIAEPLGSLPKLTTTQAVARIEHEAAESLAYVNLGSSRLNIVRRRTDGHIGWIDLGLSDPSRLS